MVILSRPFKSEIENLESLERKKNSTVQYRAEKSYMLLQIS